MMPPRGPGRSYPSLKNGMKIFVRTVGYGDGVAIDSQSGVTSVGIINSTYGGSGAGSLWAQANVAGCNLPIRWQAIETSLGVYDWSAIDAIIAAVQGQNANAKFILNFRFNNYSGTGTQSWVPAYIRADSVTYGGSVGNGGEVTNASNWFPVWWNMALFARWQAFIDAAATKYKSNAAIELIEGIDETTAAYSAAQISTAGGTAFFEANAKAQYSYLKTAFGAKPVFIKMNFLPGDNGAAIADLLSWASTNGYNFQNEMAAPTAAIATAQYPAIAGSISTVTLDANQVTGRSWPVGQLRYENTEYQTTSTWGTLGYNYTDAINMLNWAAYMGLDYYSVTNTSSTTVGALAVMLPLITMGYLR